MNQLKSLNSTETVIFAKANLGDKNTLNEKKEQFYLKMY